MPERRTTLMILMPGHNAISVVVPRSPRATLVLGLLLPLLSGVVGQRYVSSASGPSGPIALLSLARMPSPVSTVSAALSAARAPSVAEPTVPQPSAAEPEPSTEAAPAPVPAAAVATSVVDVKAMLRTLWGLRRGTASSDEIARIPRSGLLRLEALHLNESIAVHPFDEQQRPDPAAMAQLVHAMRCRITGTEVPIDPQLVEILVRLHTLYGRAIQLVSGHRQPNTIGTKRTSQHAAGRAADIRIPGVGIEELKRVAMKLGARGIGLYPEKGFVHIDVRDKSRYFWIYTEARGEQPDIGTPRPKRSAEQAASAESEAEAEAESEPDAPEHEAEGAPQADRGAD
jgi:uncharacterized protein YcbK (DUF882 family)